MFLVERLMLLAGVLLLVGIVSSKFSARLGLPVLVLFLGVGMLAGEDGIGRIEFDNFAIAHAIGTLSLAAILFDGGLRTRLPALRAAWKPSALLATVGVAVTALVTGVAAWKILDVPLPVGLLLGSIVASTDAAAVFSVLRTQSVRLRERLAATLEIESGSNDPMAIFLTVGLLEVLTGGMTPGPALLRLFLMQMGVGAVVGLAAGWAAVQVVNRIDLTAAGLYPILAGALGLLAFGVAAILGGSGFLAIYLAGIVVGNSPLVFQRGTFLFMDAVAWFGQIAMFVVLGLLSTPSELVPVAGPALAIAAALILVARPLAVVPVLLAFRFDWREQLMVSWVGLKGAVPIVLATFPMMAGLPQARLLFDVVFFVTLLSATLQGWTIPWLARRLRLQEPAPEIASPVSLELSAIRDVQAEIVDYLVSDEAPVSGLRLSDLELPDGAVIAMIARHDTLVPPRGPTVIEPGDRVFLLVRRDTREAVERVFGAT